MRAVDDVEALDEFVGEKLRGDPLRVGPVRGTGRCATARDRVLAGGVDPELLSGEEADRLGGGLAHVVGDAGAEAHLDQPVEAVGEAAVDGVVLDDGIGEGACGGRFQFRGRQVAVDRVDLDGLDCLHGDAEVLDDPRFDLFSEGVPDSRLKCDFDAIGHAFSR